MNTFNILMFWTVFNLLAFALTAGSGQFYSMEGIDSFITRNTTGNNEIIGSGRLSTGCTGNSSDLIPCGVDNEDGASGSTIIRFSNVLATIWKAITFVFQFATMPIQILGHVLHLPEAIVLVVGIPMTIMYILGWLMLIRGVA